MRYWRYVIAAAWLGLACTHTEWVEDDSATDPAPTGVDGGKKKKKSDAGVPPADGTEDDQGEPEGQDEDNGGEYLELPDVPATTSVTIQAIPGDNGDAIRNAILGAQSSVHMTMYLLTDSKMVAALCDRKAAGKDVKVVLNKVFPDATSNQSNFTKLANCGVEVHWASSRFTYTHAKTIVIDSAKAVIMTMNLTYTSPRTNREYIATDTDADDVATLERIFTADFNGLAITIDSKLVVSPEHDNSVSPRSQIVSFIDSAKTSLDIEIQTMSDRNVVDAIIRAQTRGVSLRLLVDGDVNDSNAELAALARMKGSGVHVKSLQTPDLHAKVIVVDAARTFVGSQNFTSNALDNNREVGVIAESAAEAAKVRAVIAGDYENAVDL